MGSRDQENPGGAGWLCRNAGGEPIGRFFGDHFGGAAVIVAIMLTAIAIFTITGVLRLMVVRVAEVAAEAIEADS